MANAIYNSFKQDIFSGDIDLNTDTLKVMLVSGAYTPDIDAHSFRSSVTSEVIGSGYVAGGLTLSGVSVTKDNTNDRSVFDASDSIWVNATITDARGAVLYKSTGNAATDRLIEYVDFGSNKSSSAGDFKIEWGANGIITAT